MVEDIKYGKKFLEQEEKLNPEEKPTISMAITLGRKICLKGYVICYWQLEEAIEEKYILSFRFKKAVLTQNLKGGYSHYQVQKNSNGIPVLVRVPE